MMSKSPKWDETRKRKKVIRSETTCLKDPAAEVTAFRPAISGGRMKRQVCQPRLLCRIAAIDAVLPVLSLPRPMSR